MNEVLTEPRPAAAPAPTNGLSHWLQRIGGLSDAELALVMTAALKSCAARCEGGAGAAPIIDVEATSATEVVVVVSALIRAADLNLFDVAMWYRRPVRMGADAADKVPGGVRG